MVRFPNFYRYFPFLDYTCNKVYCLAGDIPLHNIRQCQHRILIKYTLSVDWNLLSTTICLVLSTDEKRCPRNHTFLHMGYFVVHSHLGIYQPMLTEYSSQMEIQGVGHGVISATLRSIESMEDVEKLPFWSISVPFICTHVMAHGPSLTSLNTTGKSTINVASTDDIGPNLHSPWTRQHAERSRSLF